MGFKDYHHHVKHKVEQELVRFFDEELAKAQTKDDVLVDMVEVLKEFVLRGGKRVGPLMTVLAYQYAGNSHSSSSSNGNIFRLACALELHHLYLLNLDDMADRDVLRHGGPTLDKYYQNSVFGTWPDADHHGRTFSSIAGALLSSYTTQLTITSGFPAETACKALEVINDMLFADTVVGWQIQYFQNNQPLAEASEERFLKGLEYVTSRYKFVGPMKVGLIMAGVTGGELLHAFEKYGKHVGIAFQIYDDIMGMFGDPKEMGKAVGNDVREGKKTLLLQRAYRNSVTDDQLFLADVCGRELTSVELERVQHIVKKTGSLEYSMELAKQHVSDAISALEKLPVQNEFTEILKDLANYMIERTK